MPVTYTTEPNYYDDARTFKREDDHIEMDVNVEGWSRSLRLRSLTIPQRERINRIAGVGKERDWVKFYTHTMVEGFVNPRLTPSDAAEMVDYHNGELIEEVSETIWNLGTLWKTFRKYQDALKAAEEQRAIDKEDQE